MFKVRKIGQKAARAATVERVFAILYKNFSRKTLRAQNLKDSIHSFLRGLRAFTEKPGQVVGDVLWEKGFGYGNTLWLANIYQSVTTMVEAQDEMVCCQFKINIY